MRINAGLYWCSLFFSIPLATPAGRKAQAEQQGCALNEGDLDLRLLSRSVNYRVHPIRSGESWGWSNPPLRLTTRRSGDPSRQEDFYGKAARTLESTHCKCSTQPTLTCPRPNLTASAESRSQRGCVTPYASRCAQERPSHWPQVPKTLGGVKGRAPPPPLHVVLWPVRHGGGECSFGFSFFFFF